MFDLGYSTPDGKWQTRPSTALTLGTCTVTPLDDVVTSPLSKQQLTNAPVPREQALRVHFNEENLTLTTIQVLGTGGFGTVFAARSPSGASFALKISSKPLSEKDLQRLRDEVRVMTAFADHPNVVRIHCAALCGDKAYIAMERCMAKNLNDILMSRPMHTDEFKWVGYQLVETIASMHHANYIHRDIKPQNLLFDREGNLKITDFGLSSKLATAAPRKTVAGTQLFMAPEIAAHYKRTMEAQALGVPVRDRLSYGAEIDVWSLGIVFFIMATRKSPYQHHRTENEREWQQRVMEVIADADWEWPESCGPIDPVIRNLVEGILTRDRNRRPSIDAILKHPVWNDRPLTCPLTLLGSLSLLQDVASPQAKLRSLGPNTPSAKRTVAEVVEAGLNRIRAEETVRRGDIDMEWSAFIYAMDGIETLYREQQILREEVITAEAADRVRITASMRKPRVTSTRSTTRASSLAIATRVAAEDPNLASLGTIISASPERVDLHYPDRASATRWGLRSVISVPVESLEFPNSDRCVNNHLLRKITEMEKGVECYVCDVCGSSLRALSRTQAILRCKRCDYDVCTTCAMTPDANRKKARYVCKSCNKRFLTDAKLRGHADNCRGASASPGRSSLDNSMIAELVVGNAPASGRTSVTNSSVGRTSRNSALSVGRPSTGGRISTGSSVGSVEDMSPLSAPRARPSILKNTPKLEEFGRLSVYERPGQEELLGVAPPPPRRLRLVDEASPPDQRPKSATRAESSPARTKGNPTPARGTAADAARVGGPGGSARSASATRVNMQIEIRSTAAERPQDVSRKPPPSPRTARSGSRPPPTNVTVLSASERRELSATAHVTRAEPLREPPSSRAHSKRPLHEDAVLQDRRPQPNHRDASPQMGPRRAQLPAPPPQQRMAPPPLQPPQRMSASLGTGVPAPQRLSATAFVNIPQDTKSREEFVHNFLSGGWIRHYAFANNDVAALYYCLQPGRFGAMFIDPRLNVMSTAVLDIHTSIVLYVRDLSSDFQRPEVHPHVATAYNDDIRIMNLVEAQSIIGGVVQGIRTYVSETRRAVAQGQAAFYITAPYVQRKETEAVARDTKFTYLRKAFPDPDGGFCLFRLSTRRSQIIVPDSSDMEIRWQTGADGKMTSRYYVYADGQVKAFHHDTTGILTSVENVLLTVYHTQ